MTNPRHHQNPTLNLFKARDIDQVQRWIDAGADVNARNKKGATPLFNAARKGWPDAVRLLLASGARIEVSNDSGETLAMAAARSPSWECFDLLLGAGMNPVIKGRSGENGLMLATDAKVMQALINAGDSVHDVDNMGRGAVHHVAMRDMCSVRALMPFLISKGANINMRDSAGCTPLMLAFNQIAIDALLDLGADASACNNVGENVLHYIVRHPFRMSDDVLARCMDAGADPYAENKEGYTPVDIITQHMNKGGWTQEVLQKSIAMVEQKMISKRTQQAPSPRKTARL